MWFSSPRTVLESLVCFLRFVGESTNDTDAGWAWGLPLVEGRGRELDLYRDSEGERDRGRGDREIAGGEWSGKEVVGARRMDGYFGGLRVRRTVFGELGGLSVRRAIVRK